MLSELQLRDFRCFEALRVELGEGFNFFLGCNGEGKTSLLEAACVLLRLQSQRSASLVPAIRVGAKSFRVSGQWAGHALDFRYSGLRRKLSFDQIDQRQVGEYLRLARVVSFANTDIELVRGSGEARRRFLDFLGAQADPGYRPTQRAYERALRSRNALLKAPSPRPRSLAAYDALLLEHGARLSALRADLAALLAPEATSAYREISAGSETLTLYYMPGNGEDFAADLAQSKAEEQRLRQTVVGPHRDDLALLVEGRAAAQYASEGQQRTVALALKMAQARVFAQLEEVLPLFLIDDVFGELDTTRRNRLLETFPVAGQKLVTATTMSWREQPLEGAIFDLHARQVRRRA